MTVDEDFAATETVTVTPGAVPSDEAEQTVTYSLSPASVAFANVSIDSVTGEVSITAVANGNGTQLFTLTADDGQAVNNTATQTFTLTVTAVNDTPTDIDLSSNEVAENEDPGTPVGTFTTTDPDSGDTSFEYTLMDGVTGCDGSGNDAFQISGATLQTAEPLDYETQVSYAICVQTNDGNGGLYQEAFTINVTDVPENSYNYLLWTK